MYQVIENAGQDNETIVAKFDDFHSANIYVDGYGHEAEELGVDILKDGSTEF